MNVPFASVEDALGVLADPSDPRWLAAFAWLSRHPETASMILETFRETLEEMGAQPSGVDPRSGEPVFSVEDVARALGISGSDLERAADLAGGPRGIADDSGLLKK